MRLQKIIAAAGIASRRKAEALIEEGRVTVNGKPAVLGMKADPLRDHVKVDGKLITRVEPPVYLIFNKPAGVMTTLSDPEGRPTLKAYLGRVKQRVFPVGRLDFQSEGLVLLTNDGDLADAVMHPSRKVPKKYRVKVKGIPSEEKLQRLRDGIRLEDGMTMPAHIRRIGLTREGKNTWLSVTVYEGKNRLIRRMFERIRHPVMKLRRVAINGITLGLLKPGEYRFLTDEEVRRLRKEAGMKV